MTRRDVCDFVDTCGAGLPLADRLLLAQAPIAIRNAACTELVGRFIVMYKEHINVELGSLLDGTPFMTMLEVVERRMMRSDMPRASSEMLGSLESFHKALVVYLWMSYRHPVAWNSHTEVAELKERVEKALEWTLQALTKGDAESPHVGQLIKLMRERDRKDISYSTPLKKRQQALGQASR